MEYSFSFGDQAMIDAGLIKLAQPTSLIFQLVHGTMGVCLDFFYSFVRPK